MAKDLTKDITYYFKWCLKFNALKLSLDISESTIVAIEVAMENEVKSMICSNEASTTSKTAPARV